jgi:hypothetical protein
MRKRQMGRIHAGEKNSMARVKGFDFYAAKKVLEWKFYVATNRVLAALDPVNLDQCNTLELAIISGIGCDLGLAFWKRLLPEDRGRIARALS